MREAGKFICFDANEKKWSEADLYQFLLTTIHHILRVSWESEGNKINALAEYLGVEFKDVPAQPAKVVCQKKEKK